MSVTPRTILMAVAAAVMLGQVGCTSMSGDTSSSSLMNKLPWVASDDDSPEPYPNPVKMAATWTPDTLVQTGKTPTRGFGGRIFFYDEKSRPVPVDGTLVIHGFDDQAPNPKDRVKRFEFTPEQFTRHFGQSDLGASYSVWVPWDAIGGDQRRVAMVASFQSKEGKTIQGLPATIMLPGRKPAQSSADEIARMSPQYQRFLQAQHSASPDTSGLTTTTIRRDRRANSFNEKPSITIPNTEDDSMLAGGGNTPSLDVDMRRSSPTRSQIMPASAQLPMRR